MTTNSVDYDALRQQLHHTGSCQWTDAEDRRLFFIAAGALNIPEDEGLLIAYEGEGTFFHDLSRPLNVFRLLSAGFSAGIAAMLADVVNRLCSVDTTPEKALEPLLLLPSEPSEGNDP